MISKHVLGLLFGIALPLHTALAAEIGAATETATVLGLSVPGLDYPLYAELKQAAEAEAAALGVKLVVADAHGSADRQVGDLLRFVDQHVKGILYSPISVALVAEALDEAAAAGIPAVQLHAGKGPEKALGSFSADDVSGGRMAAKFVIQRLGGKGAVLELVAMGPAWNGFRASLDAELRAAKLEVFVAEPLEIQQGRAQQAVAALLREQRRFDAILAVNDRLALGAVEALRAAGIDPASKVIVGLDGLPEARRAVQEGTLSATLDPRIGEQARLGVRCLVTRVRTGAAPLIRDVYLPPLLFTRATQNLGTGTGGL